MTNEGGVRKRRGRKGKRKRKEDSGRAKRKKHETKDDVDEKGRGRTLMRRAKKGSRTKKCAVAAYKDEERRELHMEEKLL